MFVSTFEDKYTGCHKLLLSMRENLRNYQKYRRLRVLYC